MNYSRKYRADFQEAQPFLITGLIGSRPWFNPTLGEKYLRLALTSFPLGCDEIILEGETVLSGCFGGMAFSFQGEVRSPYPDISFQLYGKLSGSATAALPLGLIEAALQSNFSLTAATCLHLRHFLDARCHINLA